MDVGRSAQRSDLKLIISVLKEGCVFRMVVVACM